jgi:hypothetical protein
LSSPNYLSGMMSQFGSIFDSLFSQGNSQSMGFDMEDDNETLESDDIQVSESNDPAMTKPTNNPENSDRGANNRMPNYRGSNNWNSYASYVPSYGNHGYRSMYSRNHNPQFNPQLNNQQNNGQSNNQPSNQPSNRSSFSERYENLRRERNSAISNQIANEFDNMFSGSIDFNVNSFGGFMGNIGQLNDILERSSLQRIMNNLSDPVKITLTEDALNDLSDMKYEKVKEKLPGLDNDECCSICFSKLNEETEKYEYNILPCNHVFHTDCIKEYLKNYNYSCPICKTECGEHKANI